MLNDEKRAAIAILAEADFKARERVRMMEIMNVPADYEERKSSTVQLAIARAEAIATARALSEAINNA